MAKLTLYYEEGEGKKLVKATTTAETADTTVDDQVAFADFCRKLHVALNVFVSLERERVHGD